MNKQMILVVTGIALLVTGGLGLLAMPHVGTGTPSSAVASAAVISASSTGSSIQFGNISNSIITGGLGFFSKIVNAIWNDLFAPIVGALGTAGAQIFSNWGYSVTAQGGVFAPVLAVVVLGVAGMVIYFMLDAMKGEKDVLSAEEDI